MSITPLRFTGVSSFSEDFQAILSRAVSIAAVPVRQMQNEQADLITKKQTLTAMGGAASELASAIRNLGRTGATRALTVTSSNANRATVVNNGLTAAATYTLSEITSVAKAASETTASGFATADATAADADGVLELVLGGQAYALNLGSSNHLNGLRDAINALGAGVTATILNTGVSPSPYHLSLTATAPGATTLALRTTAGDAGSNILTSSNQGANAVFKLNGLAVTRSDNVITDVVSGLTFTIRDTTSPGETVVLTAQSSRGTLAADLTTFVAAYNNTREKLNAQIGEQAGLLSGDFLVSHLSRTLRAIAGYTGAGTARSLVDLGIELDKNGVMSFNSVKFYSLPTATIDAGYTLLGSETTGFGAYSQELDQISNPVTGLIKTQQDAYDTADRRLAGQIAELTRRIGQMQSTLSSKLQQADVLLSALQRQQDQLETSLRGVNAVAFGTRNE